jgi:hypothetical protein
LIDQHIESAERKCSERKACSTDTRRPDLPESASENRAEHYKLCSSSQIMLAMVHDDWCWFRNCPMQLFNKCAKHIDNNRPKQKSQTAHMRGQKPQMPHVCKGTGQLNFGRRHAPTRCMQTCIVLAYADSNATGSSIPNSKTFKIRLGNLAVEQAKAKSGLSKFNQKPWNSMEGHCNPWRAIGIQ